MVVTRRARRVRKRGKKNRTISCLLFPLYSLLLFFNCLLHLSVMFFPLFAPKETHWKGMVASALELSKGMTETLMTVEKTSSKSNGGLVFILLPPFL